MQYLTVGISLLALTISGLTLWLSHIRRGSLKMTRPTVVFFGPDGGEGGISKIFLRTLLYSTAKRGVVLENLYVRLRRGETQQNFNIWVYGEKDLARGSGLFIGQEGIATNHHFLTPTDVSKFDFAAGDYRLEVFGKTVNQEIVSLLSSIELRIEPSEAEKLRKQDHGIYFDWGPDAARYQTKIEMRKSKPTEAIEFLKALKDGLATAVPTRLLD
jgi:hypothetical protein